MAEGKTRLTYYLPDHLVDAFQKALEQEAKDSNGKSYGVTTKVITAALEEFLDAKPVEMLTVASLNHKKVKAEPEAVAYEMKPGVSYSIKDVMYLTGLSRTTISRILRFHPHLFQVIDPDTHLKTYELVEKARAPKKKRRTKRKGKPAYRANTTLELIRKANEGLSTFQRNEDDFDDFSNPIVALRTYVDLGEGRERQLGYLEDKVELAVFEMKVDKIITQEEHDVFLLKYYYEDTSAWREAYPDEAGAKLKKLLKKFKEVEPKIEGYLEEYIE